MNKILIVGHPFSGCQAVARLLMQHGMSPAKPSLKERVSPIDVGSILCQAHGIDPAKMSFSEGCFRAKKIEVNGVWNGLVMDLLRGNLDLDFWGWTDPMAIYLLDFWKQAVSDMTFILVYNHPRSVFVNTGNDSQALRTLDPETGDDVTLGWKSYNEALIHFYHRNMDRCLLVHADALRNSEENVLSQIRATLGDGNQDVNMAGRFLAGNGPQPPASVIAPGNESALAADSSAHDSMALSVLDDNTHLAPLDESEVPLSDFVVTSVLEHLPEEILLYEELQSVATMPYTADSPPQVNPMAAWRTLTKLKAEKISLAEKVSVTMENLQLLEQKRQELKKEWQRSEAQRRQQESELEAARTAQRQALQQAYERHRNEMTEYQTELKGAHQDYDVAMSVLHRTQDQLEKVFHQNQNLKKHIDVARKRISTLTYTGAPARVKEELEYQLGATIVSHFKSVWKLLFLPLSLWLVARKYKKTVGKRHRKLPPLSMYEDFSGVKGVKKHLSYRLGWVWLKYSRTPFHWPALPGVLMVTYAKYLRERARTKKKRK